MGDYAKVLGPRVDFEFAFNDIVFSDRVLYIEVMPDSPASDFDGLDCVPSNKRQKTDNSEDEIGDESESSHSNDSDYSTSVNNVRTVHISSPILAANSPFFYKLFRNGMRETQENHVTLRINASEEAALMDLLKFTYTSTLKATTATDLVNVLIAADKYEVNSCMSRCVELLQKLPMTLESACLYLDLPSSLLMSEAVQPLRDAAKLYLANFDFNKAEEELMHLPLWAVEFIFGCEDLSVSSEDRVFDYILMWARKHYTKLEERQEILSKRLLKFIYFPYLTNSKLKKALDCPELDHKQMTNLVNEALFLRKELAHGKTYYVPDDLDCSAQSSVRPFKRLYLFRPIKLVQFRCSRPRCVVYFNLGREECEYLTTRRLASQVFTLDGKRFMLQPRCINEQLFHLDVNSSNPGNWTVDCEFAVMKKPLEEFEIKHKATNCSPKKSGVASHWIQRIIMNGNLGIPWTDLMREDSQYFINGILHLRVELTLNKLL